MAAEDKKSRRRAERLEEEARAAQAKQRSDRIQLVGAVVVVVAVTLLGIGMFTGKLDIGGGSDAQGAKPVAGAALPAPRLTDVQAAADAAGCRLAKPENEGRGHKRGSFTRDDYAQNPPTSGDHHPNWAPDGVYPSGETPPLGELVHTLEHGRVNVQYRPGTAPRTVTQLETLLAETDGYHLLLYENPTGMDAAVAATAWDAQLLCAKPGPQLWDALRTFREAFLDQGPETVP